MLLLFSFAHLLSPKKERFLGRVSICRDAFPNPIGFLLSDLSPQNTTYNRKHTTPLEVLHRSHQILHLLDLRLTIKHSATDSHTTQTPEDPKHIIKGAIRSQNAYEQVNSHDHYDASTTDTVRWTASRCSMYPKQVQESAGGHNISKDETGGRSGISKHETSKLTHTPTAISGLPVWRDTRLSRACAERDPASGESSPSTSIYPGCPDAHPTRPSPLEHFISASNSYADPSSHHPATSLGPRNTRRIPSGINGMVADDIQRCAEGVRALVEGD
jgi:hypothetical protein